MFPPIFEGHGEPSAKWKTCAVLAALTERVGGATPAELADECLRWGIAVGQRAAVIDRIEQLLREIAEETETRRSDKKIDLGSDGRYRVTRS